MLQSGVNHASAAQVIQSFPMETMGDRIRTLRAAKGWTQKELAAELKLRGAPVSDNAVSQWERGETANIKLRTFLVLVDVLGATHEYLVHGPSEPGRDSAGKYRKLQPGSGNKA